jgi:hypothetical protein
MKTWTHGRPTDFEGLFKFYHQYVKLLYSEVQTQNVLPIETLFELNAAFDHISRHWAIDEPEEEVVAQAFGHLKRSCLDIFKLKVQEARSQYDALCKLDMSVIDDTGEFERQLHRLFNEIRLDATEARRLEGEPDATNSVPAFERWEAVYVKCEKLEEEFFLYPKLKWARRSGIVTFIRQNLWGFIIGVTSFLIAALLWALLTSH